MKRRSWPLPSGYGHAAAGDERVRRGMRRDRSSSSLYVSSFPVTAPFGRVMVLSAHLDDAVFGASSLLATARQPLVTTVFAGCGAAATLSTAWDRKSGFAEAAQAIAGRRCEDAAALGMLGARPHWLDFADAQYASPALTAAIAEALLAVARQERPETVVLPLGLHHPDHRQTHDAALLLRAAWRAGRWLAYQEPAFQAGRETAEQRLAQLAVAGIRATPLQLPAVAWAQKRAAAERYVSQCRALGGGALVVLAAAERYWSLADAASSLESS